MNSSIVTKVAPVPKLLKRKTAQIARHSILGGDDIVRLRRNTEKKMKFFFKEDGTLVKNVDPQKALDARDYIFKKHKIRIESQFKPYNYEYCADVPKSLK